MEHATNYTQQATKAPEIEIYYKTAVNVEKRPVIKHPDDICNIMYEIGEMNRNLQYKESDRLHALATQLQPYADIEITDNELHVVGNGQPIVTGAGFDTCHDHRLAMAFLLFPKAELNDTDCLAKSYPGLLSLFI